MSNIKLVKKMIKEAILSETNNYSIEDFPIGAIVTDKDGDVWKVSKPGMRGPDSRLQPNEVYLMPYKRSGIGWDANLDYLNKNVVKIEK